MLPTIKPKNGHIFVRRDLSPEMVGSIKMPEKSRDFEFTGTVVAVGEGLLRTFPKTQEPVLPSIPAGCCSNAGKVAIQTSDPDHYPVSIKVGDRVLVPPSSNGFKLNPDDDSDILFCYTANQIMAVIE